MIKNNSLRLSNDYRDRGRNGVVPFLPITMIMLVCLLMSLSLLMIGCKESDQELIPLEETAEFSDTVKLDDEKNSPKTGENAAEKVSNENIEDQNDISIKDDKAFVYVCGAVKKPDVYELSADCHVVDGIMAAGGLLEDADGDAINLASKVSDGMKIYVPREGEVSEGTELIPEVGEAVNDVININVATKEQLMTLPGIGEGKASKIVEYRENNGPFSQISDIMNVNGIKNGAYEKIKDLISVN